MREVNRLTDRPEDYEIAGVAIMCEMCIRDRVRLVETALAGLDMPAVVGGLWEAALFGYAVAEVLWERRGGFILPASVVAKPQEWFTFDSAGRLLFMAVSYTHLKRRD